MSIKSDKKINEGLFSKIVDLVFFKGIDKVVSKAEQEITEKDPEAAESIGKEMQQVQAASKETEAKLEEFCKHNPNSALCKEWVKQGRPTLNEPMEW